MNDYDSDNSDDSDNSKPKDQLIDEFELNESEKIHDFYYNLKNRFPYFIDCMEYHNIFDFIIDKKFLQYQRYNISASNYQLVYFQREYCDEINTTLVVLNNFFRYQSNKIYKNIKINYQDWFEFCYNFTSIKKPISYSFV